MHENVQFRCGSHPIRKGEAFVAPGSPYALWFITGAGGVGKTALLRYLHDCVTPELGAGVRVSGRAPPEAFHVVCDAHENPHGVFLMLDMETMDPEARAADPLTHRLWQALTGELALHPGEHAPFIRCWPVRWWWRTPVAVPTSRLVCAC